MPWSIDDEIYQYGAHLPPGPVLFLVHVLDTLPILPSTWRDHVPFGWANAPHGFLSYHVESARFPRLKSYSEVPGGLLSFLTTSSTVLGDLTNPPAIATVLLLVIIFRNFKKRICFPFFQHIGYTLASRTHGTEWCNTNQDRIIKFGEYCFRLVFHSSISLFGLHYFASKEWWDPSRGGTLNLWLHHPHQPIEPGMIWYYLIQAAYNVEVLLYMLEFSFQIQFYPMIKFQWKPTARGDFREMLIHHFVTISLIYFSSYFRFTRAGSMVFLIHDVSDVPVDLSKLANFLKWKISTVICFTSMVFLWLVTRLGVFPFVVIQSMLWESQILIKEGMPPEYYYAHKPGLMLLILIILALHFVWFGMFLRMGWILVNKGQAHDLSEFKNGERLAKENKED